ncbi:cation:proton antiporter [Streptomyces sp. NPDC007157]|uniref:cation:proton antiporter domain-containing protein n=1 Tax=Streptomyces sp. NPDC007157 TaxID=3154681 RepID=UPI0033D677D9
MSVAGEPEGGPPRSRGTARSVVVYGLLVLVPVALALLLLRFGVSHPVKETAGAPQPTEPADLVGQVLVAGAVVVAAAGLLGLVARAVGQSPVVGEILAGLLLGPSVFGALAPGVSKEVFPAAVTPVMNNLAQVGVVFFMFLIGLEMPLTMLRRLGGKVLSAGHAALAVPFLLGMFVALRLRGDYQPDGVRTAPFLLFVALSVSVTAFPVLARILSDRELIGTRLGAMGLAMAGVGDVTAWCALGVVVAEVRSDSPLGVLVAVAEVVAFTSVLWFVVRPALAQVLRLLESRRGGVLPIGTLITAFVLICAVVTNMLGVHAIFGAFLAGVVMPRSSRTVMDFAHKTEGLALWLLLPFFFAAVGLQTRLQSVFSLSALGVLSLVLLVAVAGKIGGTFAAARLAGEGHRESLGLGVMMNCRGLTELVVLNVGLSLGVIDSRLFAVLVVMTLVTTVATDPLLRLLRLDRLSQPLGGGLSPVEVPTQAQETAGTRQQ